MNPVGREIARTAVLSAAIALSLWKALHSLLLGLALIEPMPFQDQWRFIDHDYFRWLDGGYRLIDLFAKHNEHRFATTRLVLFADGAWFAMRGVMPIVVTYAALAATGAIIAAVCSDTRKAAITVFLLGLGLVWATCQWVNLSTAFQVQIPLEHVFAAATLAALAVSFDRRSGAWLAAAAAADFLAVFSLGSGVFLIVPAVLLALWLRRFDPRLGVFVAFHAALVIVYFDARLPPTYAIYGFAPVASAQLMLTFIGLPAGAFSRVAGVIGTAWLLLLLGFISYRAAAGERVDRGAATLAAIAVFAAIEAVVVAYTRFAFGVGPRYATAALFFWAAMLGASWRLIAPRFEIVLVGALCLLIVTANSPANEAAWRGWVAAMEAARADLAAGALTPQALAQIYPPAQKAFLPDAIRRLQALRLGPFD
jgi:hypothetical protein